MLQQQHLLLHAHGALGLVEHGLVAGVILAAGSLVLEGLAGGLLAVGDGVTVAVISTCDESIIVEEDTSLPLDLVSGTGDGVTDLVDGGLLALRSGLVGNLCAAGQWPTLRDEGSEVNVLSPIPLRPSSVMFAIE